MGGGVFTRTQRCQRQRVSSSRLSRGSSDGLSPWKDGHAYLRHGEKSAPLDNDHLCRPRERPPGGDNLKTTTVCWFREVETAGNWTRKDVAMARSLLERWIATTIIPAKCHDDTAARFSTLIIKRWLHERKSTDRDTRELMPLFYRVLHLWQKSTSTQSPGKIVNLLQTFYNYSVSAEEPWMLPGPRAYSMVFQTLIKLGETSAMRATTDELMAQLRSQEMSPDALVAHNSYLQLLATRRDTPEKAELFLKECMTTRNAKSYAALLQAWTYSGRADGIDRACELLDEMVENGSVNRVCFNICLQGLGNAGHGQRAQDLLWRMERLFMHDGNEEFRPDVYSFLAVINAWAKDNNPEQATSVLEHILQRHDTFDLSRTTSVYTAVMDAWARRHNSGPRVEALLHRLEDLFEAGGAIRPCRIAYTIAIRAWGGTATPDAPDRATEILRLMAERSKAPGRSDLAPCTIAYTSLLRAWAQSSRNDAPQRALTILRHMEKIHRETGQQLVAPDTRALNTVLSAFARHGKVEEASSLLAEMKARSFGICTSGVRPDAISWATVIDACGKRRRSGGGGELANGLLHELENLYDATGDNSLKPTPRIYAAVILAHASNTGAAEAVLWRMVDRYTKSVSEEPFARALDQPDTYVCNALLQVWSQSDDPVAPQKAESLLRWMEDQVSRDRATNLIPDRTSFTYVLRTWKMSGRRNARGHVERIQLEMKSNYPHLMLV